MRGRGTVVESLALVEDMATLVWDPREVAVGKRVEHPGCANHLCDVLLYAWRAAYPYLAVPEPAKPPAPGSPDWFRGEAEQMFAELAEIDARKAEERAGLGDSENWDSWATQD